MKGTLTIKIDKRITEQKLIENCLMYYHSGYNYMLLFTLYAFAKRWNITKLVYYKSLIEK